MARYIDADEMLKFIKKTNENYHWLLNQYNACWIYDFIESQPTADVVPRSEIVKIFEEIDELVKEHSQGYCCDWYLYKLIAELKKKYTENDETSV